MSEQPPGEQNLEAVVFEAIRERFEGGLDENAEDQLNEIVVTASRRRKERSDKDFQIAIDELADRLPGALEQVRMRRDTPSDREVTKRELNAAMKLVCPLWPFC